MHQQPQQYEAIPDADGGWSGGASSQQSSSPRSSHSEATSTTPTPVPGTPFYRSHGTVWAEFNVPKRMTLQERRQVEADVKLHGTEVLPTKHLPTTAAPPSLLLDGSQYEFVSPGERLQMQERAAVEKSKAEEEARKKEDEEKKQYVRLP